MARSVPSDVVLRTVEGMGYELVDLERLPRGLLRVSIDRVPGQIYPTGASEHLLVEDCEIVTRQLQSVMEVENIDYERLEVSSPGLDRPLRKPSDWKRFAGLEVEVTLKLPFQGRRRYRGVLLGVDDATGEAGREATAHCTLRLTDGSGEQALSFTLDEVRDARLVPVVDFKGRRQAPVGEQKT